MWAYCRVCCHVKYFLMSIRSTITRSCCSVNYIWISPEGVNSFCFEIVLCFDDFTILSVSHVHWLKQQSNTQSQMSSTGIIDSKTVLDCSLWNIYVFFSNEKTPCYSFTWPQRAKTPSWSLLSWVNFIAITTNIVRNLPWWAQSAGQIKHLTQHTNNKIII